MKRDAMNLSDSISLLKTQSLQSIVQEELERMILDGRLKPGAAIREATIATSMGVSRGPVREALRALEERGLVRVEKNYGVYVREISIDEVDDIYAVRINLEKLVGELVVQKITDSGEKELSDLCASLVLAVASADVALYTQLNHLFHDTLVRLTGNHKLHETYARLVAQLSLYRRAAYVSNLDAMRVSLSEHQAIFDAVKCKDACLTSSLLARHAEDSQCRLHGALLITPIERAKG